MTVRQLIIELLGMPLDAKVDIVHSDSDGEYDYQSALITTYYEEDHTVGVVGIRKEE